MLANSQLWTSITTLTISAFLLSYSILPPHGYSAMYNIHDHNTVYCKQHFIFGTIKFANVSKALYVLHGTQHKSLGDKNYTNGSRW